MEKAWKVFAFAVIAVCVFVGIIGLVYLDAKMKADAYERVTGKHIDPWDAFILDVKVHQ